MNIQYSTCLRQFVGGGVKLVIVHASEINRQFKENCGIDLAKTSPEALAQLVKVALDTNLAMADSVSSDEDVIDLYCAVECAHDETSVSFTYAVKSFYAVSLQNARTLHEVNASWGEQLKFASDHCHLFESYFTVFKSKYEGAIMSQRFFLGGDE